MGFASSSATVEGLVVGSSAASTDASSRRHCQGVMLKTQIIALA